MLYTFICLYERSLPTLLKNRCWFNEANKTLKPMVCLLMLFIDLKEYEFGKRGRRHTGHTNPKAITIQWPIFSETCFTLVSSVCVTCGFNYLQHVFFNQSRFINWYRSRDNWLIGKQEQSASRKAERDITKVPPVRFTISRTLRKRNKFCMRTSGLQRKDF